MTELTTAAAKRSSVTKTILFCLTMLALAGLLIFEIRGAHWSWQFATLFFLTLIAFQIVLNRILPWIDRVFFHRGK
jgi:uncharacterized membrane protein